MWLQQWMQKASIATILRVCVHNPVLHQFPTVSSIVGAPFVNISTEKNIEPIYKALFTRTDTDQF